MVLPLISATVAGSTMFYHYMNDEPAVEVAMPAIGASLAFFGQRLEDQGIQELEIAQWRIPVAKISDIGCQMLCSKLIMMPGMFFENIILESWENSLSIKILNFSCKHLITNIILTIMEKIFVLPNHEEIF